MLSVPTSVSTLERSTRVGFPIFRGPFPVPGIWRAVFVPKCWKIPSLARKYQTRSQNFEPSVPTSLSTLERSARVRFGIFGDRSPFRTPGGPFSSLSVGESQVSLVII